MLRWCCRPGSYSFRVATSHDAMENGYYYSTSKHPPSILPAVDQFPNKLLDPTLLDSGGDTKDRTDTWLLLLLAGQLQFQFAHKYMFLSPMPLYFDHLFVPSKEGAIS